MNHVRQELILNFIERHNVVTIKQLQQLGKSVPGDVSVMGINDIGMSRYAQTPLATMGVDADEVCRVVFEILQNKLKNPYYKEMQKIQIKNELIIRQSIRRLEKE